MKEDVAWRTFWQIEHALEYVGYEKYDWSSDDPNASQTLTLSPNDDEDSRYPWIKISRLVSDFADDEADFLDCVKAYRDINDYVTGLVTGHPSLAPWYDAEAGDCDTAH